MNPSPKDENAKNEEQKNEEFSLLEALSDFVNRIGGGDKGKQVRKVVVQQAIGNDYADININNAWRVGLAEAGIA